MYIEKERERIQINYFQEEGPVEAGRAKREKIKKRNVYDTDAILSTEFPVFHEDFSGRSG